MSKNNLFVDKEKKMTIMERVFDAPRELVWKAHTDPSLVTQWWGPRSVDTIVDVMEIKPGGKWRFIHKDKDGKEEEYGFRGEYKEVDAPQKLTWTFEWEGMPGHVITETMEFTEESGKTKLKTTSHYQSLEDLEGMLSYGMEQGATESWDRLEELVTKK